MSEIIASWYCCRRVPSSTIQWSGRRTDAHATDTTKGGYTQAMKIEESENPAPLDLCGNAVTQLLSEGAQSGAAEITLAWITTGFPPEVSGVALGNAERARWFAVQPGVRLVVMAPDLPEDGPAAVGGRVGPWHAVESVVRRYPTKP